MPTINVFVWVPCRADSNGIGLTSDTNVANVDIVVARGEISTGSKAQCDVAAATGVVEERIKTVGRVARCPPCC